MPKWLVPAPGVEGEAHELLRGMFQASYAKIGLDKPFPQGPQPYITVFGINLVPPLGTALC